MYQKPMCKDCGRVFTGRSDKMFCEHTCRSNFHNRLNREEVALVNKINKILKANRKIMQKLNSQGKVYVHRLRLEKIGFNFEFFTHIHKGSGGKVYYCVYEYRYSFKSSEIVEIMMQRPLI